MLTKKIQALFCQSFVDTFVTSCFIRRYGDVNVHGTKLLNNIVNVCSKIVGVEQKSLYNIFSHCVENKAKVIMSDKDHVLSVYYKLLQCGRRYRSIKVKPRAQKTFILY